MSDERYELKGKIGQGGVGAVYRAFDNNLNREVAIKRVLPGGGYENDEEATKAMLHEATSLCSVQHPHIVTVFDAGVDSDGPYVVMELLSGRTLDEMVERGTLTYDDFREVALQSQEALIAAQDLDLVHRDIKPTNMMVTWLPSGRFQVKLVDFGLAKFSPQPSLQTIDHGDSVFGSIYFMAPEQFERTPLDQRTDMYSLGCVYYYCLTGQHPFDGETAPLVMTAHLQNRVPPLAELRPDLPKWLCDWVMWHIARDINDRPPNAREALKQFLMAETEGEMNAQIPVLAPGTNGTDPNLPAGMPAAAPVAGHTAPQPILPPEGQQPSVHTAAQQVRSRLATGPISQQPGVPAPAQSATGQVPLATPGVPNPGTGPVNVLAGQTGPIAGGLGSPPSVVLPDPNQKGLSTTAKAVIAATLAGLLAIALVYFFGQSAKNEDIERINALTLPFKEGTPQEIEFNKGDLQLVLDYLSTHKKAKKGERQTLYQALNIGTSIDGTDIDEFIAENTAELSMSDEVKQKLFMVLERRKQPSAIPALLKFASTTENVSLGKAALRAASKSVTEDDFSALLGIVRLSPVSALKVASIDILVEIVKNANNTDPFITPVTGAYRSTTDEEAREGLLRLLGAIGGNDSADFIKEALNGKNANMQLAAIAALKNWPDGSMFEEPFYNFVEAQKDGTLRTEGFNALLHFLEERSDTLEKDDIENFWTLLATISVGRSESLKIIGAMTRQNNEWAITILDYYIGNADDDVVVDKAERAMRNLNERLER